MTIRWARVFLLGLIFGFSTFASADDKALEEAFVLKQSNLQVAGAGEVVVLLPQDNVGSRHQKFVVRLTSGQTVLIAHNIDIAAKVSSLKVGDIVEFYGEYEWNAKGGVVHWTHHDPSGQHESGWLKHAGKVYQ